MWQRDAAVGVALPGALYRAAEALERSCAAASPAASSATAASCETKRSSDNRNCAIKCRECCAGAASTE